MAILNPLLLTKLFQRLNSFSGILCHGRIRRTNEITNAFLLLRPRPRI
jgi:hypothetical protein